MVEDKIADMLTRIRNANQLKYDTVDVIGTKMTCEIARILKEEGYISDYKLVEATNGNTLTLNLKYTEDKKTRVITGLCLCPVLPASSPRPHSSWRDR